MAGRHTDIALRNITAFNVLRMDFILREERYTKRRTRRKRGGGLFVEGAAGLGDGALGEFHLVLRAFPGRARLCFRGLCAIEGGLRAVQLRLGEALRTLALAALLRFALFRVAF